VVFHTDERTQIELLENKEFRKVSGKDDRGSETWLDKTAL